jgi:hypothetical protein
MVINIIDASRRKSGISGYGLMSSQFSNRLRDLGHDIRFFDEGYSKEADIWLWIRPPHYINEKYFDEKNNNVFFTMHESETFDDWKKDWPELLNKCKAVITPTEWNKKVFENNGVSVPIYVVPLGVDEKVFCGYKNRKFSILSLFDGLGSNNSRDNWKEMIKAYYKTFYDNYYNEVIYSIKSWRINWENYDRFIDEVIKENEYKRELLPPIQIYEIDLVPEDLNLFYAKHHVFMKYSRGEGWCLPANEALSVGLRILSYPNPAMVFLNKNNTDFFKDSEELHNKLWENWRRYRKDKIKRSLWSWKSSTRQLEEVLNEIIKD